MKQNKKPRTSHEGKKGRKRNQSILNNTSIEQITTMKYLGVIIEDKFKFSQDISYVADKCAKLIFSLSRSANIHWGLKHEALT